MQDSTGVTIEVTLPQALLCDTGVTPGEAGHALVRAFVRAWAKQPVEGRMLPLGQMDPLFDAAADAVEESILNARRSALDAPAAAGPGVTCPADAPGTRPRSP